MPDPTLTEPHVSSETLRKLVHIAFGLAAFSLRWLTWQQAALVAFAAFLFNWLVLPRVGGRTISRDRRGYDLGIILYPLAVLALILCFRHRLEIAGTVWAIVAFGDGFATLSGKNVRSAALPWNQAKSVAGFAGFLVAGFPAALLVHRWIATGAQRPSDVLIVAVTVVVCAVVESLQLSVDDNFSVPLAGALTMAAIGTASSVTVPPLDRTTLIWLAANALLALAGYAARSVDVSGAVGGFVLGALLIFGGGWQLYLILLAFFIIGTVLTKAGYSRKAREGLAQEKGGRRGFSHAFSNVGVASICAVLSLLHPELAPLLFVAAAASLATATADTTGSEVGQWLGRRTFLPLTLQSVPRGTEGAISVEGTLAGVVTGSAVALISALGYSSRTGLGRPDVASLTLAIALAAAIGSYLESITGNWNRERGWQIPNGVLNFFNTTLGALLGASAFLLLER